MDIMTNLHSVLNGMRMDGVPKCEHGVFVTSGICVSKLLGYCMIKIRTLCFFIFVVLIVWD